jgi:hypothetical protein
MPCRPPCSALLPQNTIHLPFLYTTRTILRLPSCRQAHESADSRRPRPHARLLDISRGGRPPKRRDDRINRLNYRRETGLHPQFSNSTSFNRFPDTTNSPDAALETTPYTPPTDNTDDIPPSLSLHDHTKGGWRKHIRPTTTTTPTDPNSTITPSERAIFDHIFRDIAQSTPPENTPEPDPSVIDSLKRTPNAPPADIETILASALPHRNANRQTKPVPDQHLAISRYPPSLREAARLASGFFLNRGGKQTKEDTNDQDGATAEAETSLSKDDFSAAVEKACSEERSAIEKELNEAAKDTDYAVWKVLEAKVFTMIARLGLDETMPSTESDGAISTRKQRTRPKPPSDPLTLDISVPEASSPTENDNPPTSPPSQPSIPPIAIIAPLYPSLLLTSLRLLSTHFPTSPLTLHILPTIKRHGPTSYVLGATTALYNELLLLRWTVYSDLKGMASLLSEMRSNGVSFDEGTLAVLERVVSERRAVLWASGERGGQVWWRRKGTRKEFWRVCGEGEGGGYRKGRNDGYEGKEGEEGGGWLGEVRREVEARREAERAEMDGSERGDESIDGLDGEAEGEGEGERVKDVEGSEETSMRVPVML